MGRLLKIRDRRGMTVGLRPNRMQSEYAAREGQRNIVLKARQVGMTTWIAARFFLATITRPGTLTVQVAHDQRAAEEIFRMVHRYWANLPQRLRRGALKTSRANVRQIVFPLLDSEYRVETAADADAGRGLTIQNLHASEVARWPREAEETLASLRAAVPPEGAVVLESTPKGSSGCFYQEWRKAEETGYTRHFFPWWLESAYRMEAVADELDEEERELVRRHGLGREQIAFRRAMRAGFRKLAPQEFAEDAESCFLAAGECVFEMEKIDSRLKVLGDGEDKEGRLMVFAPVMKGRSYIMGVDPAGGGAEGNFCCATVIDERSGMQCAELHARLTPAELAMESARLGKQYNEALIAVERNNHGHAVLAHLGRIYDNVYEQRGAAGFLTNAASRPEVLANLEATFAADVELFHSPRLLREMRSFVRDSMGRAAAAAGAHDDCVMAMGIALEVRARRRET